MREGDTTEGMVAREGGTAELPSRVVPVVPEHDTLVDSATGTAANPTLVLRPGEARTPLFDLSLEQTAARRSQRLGLPAKGETIRYIRVATSNFCDLIGSLSDAQLDIIAFTQTSQKHGAVRKSVEWVAALVMRHVDEHHPSIIEALASH